MTRKRRRMMIVLLAGIMLCTATALVLSAFQNSIVFFHTPTYLATHPDLSDAGRIRIGGLVKKGSVHKSANGMTTDFVVTDLRHDVRVSYTGILPDLFRAGQGVVVEGNLLPDGDFRASEVLAKHDERYMPPEVAAALKKSGEWKRDAVPGEGG